MKNEDVIEIRHKRLGSEKRLYVLCKKKKLFALAKVCALFCREAKKPLSSLMYIL